MHTIGQDDRGTSIIAIGQCLGQAVEWSMTARQQHVFSDLVRLQIEHAGATSLLPNVMDELLALARQPWWDAGVAGIVDEPVPGLPA